MTRRIFAALPLVGLIFAGSAHASSVNFSFGGDGNASGSGTITVGTDPYADTTGIFGTAANLVGPSSGPPPLFHGAVDPANALAITGATGFFSDVALGIDDVAITGIVATNPQNHFENDYTIPFSFGWYPAPGAVSYDNLFYAGGNAPITCLTVPPGGFFDDYGVMFTLANGDFVDLYSNGGNAPGDYGVVVWADGAGDYASAGGLSLTAPEPSTWAMMIIGFAGLGFAGYRKAREVAAIAA
jgi:hypothetical protein